MKRFLIGLVLAIGSAASFVVYGAGMKFELQVFGKVLDGFGLTLCLAMGVVLLSFLVLLVSDLSRGFLVKNTGFHGFKKGTLYEKGRGIIVLGDDDASVAVRERPKGKRCKKWKGLCGMTEEDAINLPRFFVVSDTPSGDSIWVEVSEEDASDDGAVEEVKVFPKSDA